MNEEKLSARLAKVAEYVVEGDRIADIGSDHAYLPAWLWLNKNITSAIAGEVVQGPFEAAQGLVSALGLSAHISVRLGNGLEVINKKDDVSAITIAGMGGSLISQILQRGFEQEILTGRERLILQPNIGEKTLRKWLVAHAYHIIAEDILTEDGKFYEIIVAEKATEAPEYSQRELTFGPFLLLARGTDFVAKWQSELVQRGYVLQQLEKAKSLQQAKIAEVTQEIAEIKEVIG